MEESEVLYTYEAAVNEYEYIRYQEWLQRQNKLKAVRKEQLAYRKYFLNQKLLGSLWIILNLLLTALIRDLVCLFLILPGFALLFSKKMLIVNDYYWSHNR